MLIWHLFYFDLICVVLDIWAFSLCCWVFDGSRLWWNVTMCMLVDFYEGFFEVIASIDVPEMSTWTDNCWCLLDALWWPPCSAGFWSDFKLFMSYLMGSRCRQTLTRKGGAAIWICPDHSSTDYGFNVIIWRYWRQVVAFLWLSCTSGTYLCCARTMCI